MDAERMMRARVRLQGIGEHECWLDPAEKWKEYAVPYFDLATAVRVLEAVDDDNRAICVRSEWVLDGRYMAFRYRDDGGKYALNPTGYNDWSLWQMIELDFPKGRTVRTWAIGACEWGWTTVWVEDEPDGQTDGQTDGRDGESAQERSK